MSELLDVLDEQGIQTGVSVQRSEVHKNGLWHGTVHIYVCRMIGQKVEILVHLRSASKDLYPNTWDPVLGGHIQAGNTPIQTVEEELSQEVGLSISPEDLIVGPIVKADKGSDKEFNHIFVYLFPSDASVYFKDNEVQEVRWMELDEVLRSIETAPTEWRPTCDEFLAAYPAVTSLLKAHS